MTKPAPLPVAGGVSGRPSRVRGWIMLAAGIALMLVALALPWTRFGPDGVMSYGVLVIYGGHARLAYFVAGLSVGFAVRGRQERLRRVGLWFAWLTLGLMATVAVHAIFRSETLVSFSGGLFRNDFAPGWGPFVLVAGSLLTGFGLARVCVADDRDSTASRPVRP